MHTARCDIALGTTNGFLCFRALVDFLADLKLYQFLVCSVRQNHLNWLTFRVLNELGLFEKCVCLQWLPSPQTDEISISNRRDIFNRYWGLSIDLLCFPAIRQKKVKAWDQFRMD